MTWTSLKALKEYTPGDIVYVGQFDSEMGELHSISADEFRSILGFMNLGRMHPCIVSHLDDKSIVG